MYLVQDRRPEKESYKWGEAIKNIPEVWQKVNPIQSVIFKH